MRTRFQYLSKNITSAMALVLIAYQCRTTVSGQEKKSKPRGQRTHKTIYGRGSSARLKSAGDLNPTKLHSHSFMIQTMNDVCFVNADDQCRGPTQDDAWQQGRDDQE